MFSEQDIENWFSYHPPVGNQADRYQLIRDKAREFAYLLDNSLPDSPDKTATMRKLRELVMSANMTIACNEV